MKSEIDYDTMTVTLEHALEVCSLFSSQEPNRGAENVCVRRGQVEGTNGHVFMVVPIPSQDWLTGHRLMPANQAMVESRAADNVQQVVMELPETDGPFPGTQKFLDDIKEQPASFSLLLNPFYIELIGKAFGMLGVREVQVNFRGEKTAVEIIGMIEGEAIGQAFIMPLRPYSERPTH